MEVQRIAIVVWTRLEVVLPVEDSVVTFRTAEARRVSPTAIRLWACHWEVVSIFKEERGERWGAPCLLVLVAGG